MNPRLAHRHIGMAKRNTSSNTLAFSVKGTHQMGERAIQGLQAIHVQGSTMEKRQDTL